MGFRFHRQKVIEHTTDIWSACSLFSFTKLENYPGFQGSCSGSIVAYSFGRVRPTRGPIELSQVMRRFNGLDWVSWPEGLACGTVESGEACSEEEDSLLGRDKT